MIDKNICQGDGLLFIVGCGRSGTTLLKTILNENKKVYITPETFYYNSISKYKFFL